MKFATLISIASCATFVLALPAALPETTSAPAIVDSAPAVNSTAADPDCDGSESFEDSEDSSEVEEKGIFLTSRAICSATPNAATLELIKKFEGFLAKPSAKLVGYGHKCTKADCTDVTFKLPLTKANGVKLLKKDLKKHVQCVDAVLADRVRPNDNQYGALVSWSFSVGCAKVKSSALVKRLNRGQTPNRVVAEELPKYNKIGRVILAGLSSRRKAELALFRTRSSKLAHPC